MASAGPGSSPAAASMRCSIALTALIAAPTSAPEPAALLAAPGANGTALQSGELNYCAKIEEETNYVGQDIKYDNGSNHWFPVRPPHLQMSRGALITRRPPWQATISTCCASCRNSGSDPGSPTMCACWVWGYNNNPDCKKDKFKDDSEGCCWLKRRDDDGGLCAKEASKTHASAQTFGFFGELPHDGGLPDDGSTGWAVVFGLLGIIFAVSAYSRVSPAFARNIFSLAADGVQFTLSGGRGRGGDDGGGGYSSIAGASEAPTAAAREPAGRDKRAAFADSRGRGGGERTALHAAAAVGDTHTLQKLLRSQAKLLDAGDSRNYTAFHVACAGGHVECVKALCQAGCDTEVVNDVGLTGWELAAQLQRTKINALDKGELEVRARASPVSCCGFSL